MYQVAVEEAGAQLAELVRQAQGGEEVILTQNNAPVARLTRVGITTQAKRRLGTAEGQVWMAPDFDAPLDDFKEYL